MPLKNKRPKQQDFYVVNFNSPERYNNVVKIVSVLCAHGNFLKCKYAL